MEIDDIKNQLNRAKTEFQAQLEKIDRALAGACRSHPEMLADAKALQKEYAVGIYSPMKLQA
jgi:hypothetical protein